MITYEIRDNVAVLTLNSPPANALSSSLITALDARLTEIEKAPEVKAIILQGEGRFFSAGADIKEFTALQHAADYKKLAESGQDVFSRIENFAVPVIACIHGAALGGGLELAMACHIRLVAEDAKLGLPEMTLGIIPGFAGTQRLPVYVGTAKAYEMILSGKPITGKEAYTFGLANHAVAEADLQEKAMKLANLFAEKSKPGIKQIMKLVTYAKSDRFDAGTKAEAEAFSEIFGSEDAQEGVQAFMEKRKPVFSDK